MTLMNVILEEVAPVGASLWCSEDDGYIYGLYQLLEASLTTWQLLLVVMSPASRSKKEGLAANRHQLSMSSPFPCIQIRLCVRPEVGTRRQRASHGPCLLREVAGPVVTSHMRIEVAFLEMFHMVVSHYTLGMLPRRCPIRS